MKGKAPKVETVQVSAVAVGMAGCVGIVPTRHKEDNPPANWVAGPAFRKIISLVLLNEAINPSYVVIAIAPPTT
uniref:Uncharacterized protein n=1 Tax=viral metagenome TaxID=1070528 RepID=A0A6M3L6K4_9ZZZZ